MTDVRFTMGAPANTGDVVVQDPGTGYLVPEGWVPGVVEPCAHTDQMPVARVLVSGRPARYLDKCRKCDAQTWREADGNGE